MESKAPKKAKERMIHVRLPEATHKRVRITAAEADETIQEWVARAIKNELARQGRRGDADAER
jgi:predicted HicB family RNase H-like nuclease